MLLMAAVERTCYFVFLCGELLVAESCSEAYHMLIASVWIGHQRLVKRKCPTYSRVLYEKKLTFDFSKLA